MTDENDAGDDVEENDYQDIVAVVPTRLAVYEGIDIRDFLADPTVATASDVAAEWQALSQRATWWEMGGTTHGVQRDRMTEIARLMAGAGEQLALARAALVECELWKRHRGQQEHQVGDEMCHRPMAELLSYYCLSTGHALANLTGRFLALDGRLHEWLLDELDTNLPPHSARRRDWLSCEQPTTKKLRKVARRGKTPLQQTIPDALTKLVTSTGWRALAERRAIDFHRSRPQSHGVRGVPHRSLWQYQPGGAWMLSGGIASYEDGLHLAEITADTGYVALAQLVAAMQALAASGLHLVNEINQGNVLSPTMDERIQKRLEERRPDTVADAAETPAD